MSPGGCMVAWARDQGWSVVCRGGIESSGSWTEVVVELLAESAILRCRQGLPASLLIRPWLDGGQDGDDLVIRDGLRDDQEVRDALALLGY